MNTTMADGASERLDAQIADALFGQPGMSKLDVANQLRLLRGNGKPLLCGNCYGLGVIGYTSGQTPEQFEQGEYPCPDCAQPSPATCKDSLQVQPSPAGQGELVQEALEYFERAGDAGDRKYVAAIRAALAARQPVAAAVKDSLTVVCGQAVAWMTHHEEPMLYPTFSEAAAYCDDDEPPIPLYDAPPAQAVDLGQFREAVYAAIGATMCGTHHDKLRELLALIDNAGREPITLAIRLTAGIAASDTRQWEFRDALLWAEDSADCSSHPDHKAYRFAFSELLAMIGSEEVGR